MGAASKAAGTLHMSDESWKRHANPWSVWTRLAAIPLIPAAIWSREWLDWWCLVPVAAVMVWLWLNPFVFRPVHTPTAWSSKGIYGEKLWFKDKWPVSADHRRIQRLLIVVGGPAGFALIGYGLVTLEIWPTAFGATLMVLGQLWRIDRFAQLYEEQKRIGAVQ
ncbi:hypothetical protein ITP53_50640 [Nonomuraea sp. K274]|uniref:Uncharacterized protein n=1 Tax=Nonomuraea cypriaca TaxID=1187855 RepID=A0A931F4L8_9ACTN|nr:DUF6653 family protein [Nonomuraea cypriaca]MBF8193805.1 hypothetical protein [Nonomuraea cypriaca]